MGRDPSRTAWLGAWRYAHRGLHGGREVENSPGAFRAAIAAGLGIECDIQRSLDDAPMVFHDWDFVRMFGRPDKGQRVMAADWQALRYASGDAPMQLGELLDLVAGEVPLLIEIKSRRGYDVAHSCRSVADCLRDYRGQCAVMSFDPRAPRWFAAHAPQIVRGLVATEENSKGYWGDLRRRTAFGWSRAEFLAYDIRDLPSRFAAARRAQGVPVLSWTVRSAELAGRAAVHADAPIAEGEGLG